MTRRGLLHGLWWVISDWFYLRFGNHYADPATVVGQFGRAYAAAMGAGPDPVETHWLSNRDCLFRD